MLDGQATVLLNDVVAEVGTGSFAFVPAGTQNGLRAGASGARLLLFHFPADLDRAIMQPNDQAGAGIGTLHHMLRAIGTRTTSAPAGW